MGKFVGNFKVLGAFIVGDALVSDLRILARYEAKSVNTQCIKNLKDKFLTDSPQVRKVEFKNSIFHILTSYRTQFQNYLEADLIEILSKIEQVSLMILSLFD